MPVEAFMDDRLSKTDLRVLGAIISFTDKKGMCWPRREQISERCGLNVQKISYSTTRLITFGWLKKEGNGGCSRSANYYVLKPDLFIVPESGTFIVPDSIVPESDTFIVPESDTFIVPDSGRGIKQTIEQTNEQTKRERGIRTHEISFEKFWLAYPKKKSKGDALKSWLKIKPDEQLQQTIIAAVLLAKTQDFDWQKDNGQFIPHASTYLNGKRWEDEITKKNLSTTGQVNNSGSFQQQRGKYTSKTDHNIAVSLEWLEESYRDG